MEAVVLVIVAGRSDEGARLLAERWRAEDACVLTCHDLSRPGWCHRLDGDGVATTIAIGGRTAACDEIRGVLTRLPTVTEDELPHVVAQDRAYVAAEMTAFMISWLSSLDCPVLNRPTPNCLTGPAWFPEQWVRAARDLGIPTRPMRRRVRRNGEAAPPAGAADRVAVAVVGETCLGDAEPALLGYARDLAKAARVDLLTAHFVDPGADARLTAVDLGVDTARDDIADALLAHLTRRRRC
jgi:hypothetical protein